MAELFWNRLKASDLVDLASRSAIVLLPVALDGNSMVLISLPGPTTCSAPRHVEERRRSSRSPARLWSRHRWMGLAEHHVASAAPSRSVSGRGMPPSRPLRGILRAGFKRIVIVNGHGGNTSALNALTVELTRDWCLHCDHKLRRLS